MKEKIINIAVIAHVDAGKSTLIDGLLKQMKQVKRKDDSSGNAMDTDNIEKERGITIYSKNCSIFYDDIKINIVDTPGHADFSSEVERIIKTVDTTILLVDSSEGPMPQTRYVLQKSLEQGLRPILLINKIDKKDARIDEVINLTFDLFCELGATDEQLDFPILYGMAKNGIVKREIDDKDKDLYPLLECIKEHVNPFEDRDKQPLQLQISTLQYDDYIGRLGIGRINRGTIKAGQSVTVCTDEGYESQEKISQIFINEGLERKSVDKAFSGDIVIVSGIDNISIGQTICSNDKIIPLEMIHIDEPTLSMDFYVNNSPFAGQSGKYITTRHIAARLKKELESNVGLRVEASGTDSYIVSGRGELHLSILIENMRREGYEMSISKPRVLYKRENGILLEPFEKVQISAPKEYIGSVISELNSRKGVMTSMEQDDSSYTKIEYIVATRAMLGYRNLFINDTRGEGILIRSFDKFDKSIGELPRRINGVLISQERGESMAYALFHLLSRGDLMIGPSTSVYEGMIVGINNRKEDMVVNVCKNKKLTNTRASGSDEALKLPNHIEFTLEEALSFIEDDELLEVTPDAIRLRKSILNANDRVKAKKKQIILEEK